MIRNICPGDPMDIQCCAISPEKLPESGSRSGGVGSDSGATYIPGLPHVNLRPQNYVVPDSSLFEPSVQTENDENGFFIQNIQSEASPSELRTSPSDLPNHESDVFLGDYPDEDMTTSLAEGSGFEEDLSTGSLGTAQGNDLVSMMGLPFIQDSVPTSDATSMDPSLLFEGDQGDEGDGGDEYLKPPDSPEYPSQ